MAQPPVLGAVGAAAPGAGVAAVLGAGRAEAAAAGLDRALEFVRALGGARGAAVVVEMGPNCCVRDAPESWSLAICTTRSQVRSSCPNVARVWRTFSHACLKVESSLGKKVSIQVSGSHPRVALVASILFIKAGDDSLVLGMFAKKLRFSLT